MTQLSGALAAPLGDLISILKAHERLTTVWESEEVKKRRWGRGRESTKTLKTSQ